MSSRYRRRTWAIDVCRTCERLAQWPFCEHRDAPRAADAPYWYVTITVTGLMPAASPSAQQEVQG